MGDRYTIDEFSRQFADTTVNINIIIDKPKTLFQRICNCFCWKKPVQPPILKKHNARRRSNVRSLFKRDTF